MSLALRTAEILPLHRPRSRFLWRPELCRLEVTLSGAVRGPEFVALMRAALAGAPEAPVADWLLDLRACAPGIAHADVAALATHARALAGGRDERALLVVLAPDTTGLGWVAMLPALLRPRRVLRARDAAEAAAAFNSPVW